MNESFVFVPVHIAAIASTIYWWTMPGTRLTHFLLSTYFFQIGDRPATTFEEPAQPSVFGGLILQTAVG
jgi:hypothetical protein